MFSEFREYWKIPDSQFNKPFEQQLLFILNTWFGCVNDLGIQSFQDLYLNGNPVHVPRDIFVDFEEEGYFISGSNVDLYKKPTLKAFISFIYLLVEKKYADNLQNLVLNRWEIFVLMHLAWSLALSRKIEDSYTILFNLHVPDAACIRRMEKYARCKIIHTVREPIQALGSHFKRYLDASKRADMDPTVKDSVQHVFFEFLRSDAYLSTLKNDDEFAIRLEDIHGDSEATLRSLLVKLNIPFNECVFKETFNGGDYAFQNSDGSRIKGFGGQQLALKHEDLFSANDIVKLKNILQDNYIKWGYEQSDAYIFKAYIINDINYYTDFDFLKKIEHNYNISFCRTEFAEYIAKKILRSVDDIYPLYKKDIPKPELTNWKGGVIWITGLSGAGKSTLAKHLVEDLRAYGRPAILLDGDELREVFGVTVDNSEGYSREGRLALAMQYAKLCRIIAAQGLTVVIATISLFREIHVWNRSNLPGYFEVYLNVPIEELRRRDPKGIYRKYYAGELKHVAGLDLSIDKPEGADWIVEFEPGCTVADLAHDLLKRLLKGK